MNDEKQIAKAILDAQKLRKESYVPAEKPHTVVPFVGSLSIPGEYKLDIEFCLIKACKQNQLSPNLWCLLDLAMYWHNDIQLWAEDILAGRNIKDNISISKQALAELNKGDNNEPSR